MSTKIFKKHSYKVVNPLKNGEVENTSSKHKTDEHFNNPDKGKPSLERGYIFNPSETAPKKTMSLKCNSNCDCQEINKCKGSNRNKSICFDLPAEHSASEVDCDWEIKMEERERMKINYNRSWEALRNIIKNEFKDFREEIKILEKDLERSGNDLKDYCCQLPVCGRSNLDSNGFARSAYENLITSEDEDIGLVNGLPNTTRKFLHTTKEENPELFEMSDSENDTKEILNIDRNDPELRMFAAKVGIDIDDEDHSKPNRIFRLDHLTPSYIEDPPVLNGNILGGHYGFASEFQLKERYSTETFEFLSNIVKDYAIFLKDHPSEDYPSVSELMVHSDQKLSKEESEKARYYDEKYLRASPKADKCTGTLSGIANSKRVDSGKCGNININSDCDELTKKIECDTKLFEALNHNKLVRKKQKEEKCFGYCVPSPESNVTGTKCLYSGHSKIIRHGPLVQDEVNEARKTGILNLSHRCLLEVPERIWSIDAFTQDDRKSYEENFEIPIDPSLWCTFKPLISLNLSYNSLTTIYPQGSALVSLRELRIANNMLEELPEEIGNLKNLTYLDLDTNLLKTLPPSVSCLNKLEELNLKRNFIEKLPETFGSLFSLQKLNLSFNKLLQLPANISDLQCLENINLSFNKLSCLPPEFNNLKNLEVLDLSFNKIVNLPPIINMAKLIVVNATCNAIHQFPNLCGCKMLTELRLDGNNIKNVVTENLRDCPLIQLTMANNKIEAIPDDLYTVLNLVLIDFSNNNLLWLPWSLARLKYLTVLNVDCNNISNVERSVLQSGSEKIIEALAEKLVRYEGEEILPESAKNGEMWPFGHVEILYEKYQRNIYEELNRKDKLEMRKTRCLVWRNMELADLPVNSNLLKEAKKSRVLKVDLTNNNLNFVPIALKELTPHLTELILKENYLKTIPDFIGRMKLVYLDVSFNCLDSFPLSFCSSRLKTLIVKRNSFSTIPKVIYSIYSLEHLDFERNRITEIDADRLKNLKNLSYLNLSHNSIERLPQSLICLPSLKNLNVSNNVFKQPGPVILNKGTEAILQYLTRSSKAADGVCY